MTSVCLYLYTQTHTPIKLCARSLTWYLLPIDPDFCYRLEVSAWINAHIQITTHKLVVYTYVWYPSIEYILYDFWLLKRIVVYTYFFVCTHCVHSTFSPIEIEVDKLNENENEVEKKLDNFTLVHCSPPRYTYFFLPFYFFLIEYYQFCAKRIPFIMWLKCALSRILTCDRKHTHINRINIFLCSCFFLCSLHFFLLLRIRMGSLLSVIVYKRWRRQHA